VSVSIDIKDAIARIIVHRPETRNAMTFAMYEEFYDACAGLDEDPAVKVVVVRGGGGTFIAGTDIREFLNLHTADDALAYERRLDKVVGRLEQMTKVTIAMIEGHAAGGGFSIALACDLRYAASDARVGIPIARTLGNCLSIASYTRLLDAVGPTRAKELLLTARLLSAQEAQHIGFLTGTVASADLERHVSEVAAMICQLAPLTLEASKEAIRRIQERRRGAAGDDLVVRCYLSDDFKAAVRSFLEKRTPVWTGE
jgi:enoyl-CoA hydratase/carnithine racemase